MSEAIISIFTTPLLLRAVIVGALVSTAASVLGVTLVLKRFSMIGDGLSHVGFGAFSIAYALGFTPVWFALPVVVIAAFFLLRLSEGSKIKGDAAIAAISASALSIGLIVSSISGSNADINSYMFGSIVTTGKSDLITAILLFAAVALSVILFYNKIFSVTFDESFAKATGIKASFYNTGIAVLSAATVTIGMRLMGTLLISSLIIFPPLSAMRLFRSFKSVVISSALISLVTFVSGMLLSYMYSLPVGASVVAANTIVFGLSFIIGRIRVLKK